MNLEGKKCVVCSAYLFNDDDVVFCPECGAPHHRDCYAAVGKCGLAQLHGTQEQYKNEPIKELESSSEETEKKNKSCPFCGQEVDLDARFCPYCRGSLEAMPEFKAPFMPFEVIDTKEEISEGITAGDALKVVTVNGGRYISKFKKLKNGSRLSWNWAAFLLPHGWFAFRKMYLLSALTAAAMVAASLFTVPMLIVESNSALGASTAYGEVMRQTASLISEAGAIPLICSFIGMAINLATRVLSALFADYAYKNSVVSAVKEINEAEDREAEARKKGGVSLFGFGIALVLQNLVLQLIASFLM